MTCDKNRLTCVKFQVGFACNLQCSFCLVQGQDTKKDLKVSTVENALSDPVLRQQLGRVVVTGGEPTIPRYLETTLKIIGLASELGAESTIYSNGTALDTSTLGKLAECGLTEIRLSLYEPVDWSRMARTLDRMEAFGFKRFLKVTVTRGTFALLPELLRRLPELRPDRFQIKPFNQTGIREVDEVEEMLPEQVLAMARILLEYRRQQTFRIDLLPLCYEFLVEDVPDELVCRCNCGKGSEGYLVINPQGDVLPCGAYAKAIGNIAEPDGPTLTQMWDGSQFLQTIRVAPTKAPDECRDCRHLRQCSISDCHSTTFNYYGTLTRGNPQCPILARKRFPSV